MARIPDLIRDSELETEFRGDCTVHTFHEPDPNAGGRLVPRNEFWHQEQYIGSGGFSTVFLQKCKGGGPQDGALRAVKHILIDTRAKIDHNRELEAIAKFSNPRYQTHFVKSFGWYEGPNKIFIAMEYLEIGDLAKYLDRRPLPLPENEAQQIACQILDGLNMMHRHEFAHRDLKPKNILIKKHPPGDWWIKLADFGLAKRDERSHENSLTLKGTQGYIAPELWRLVDRGTDYASDIWALGAVVHKILTKKHAFGNYDLLLLYKNQQRFPDTMLIDAGVSQMGVDFVVALMRLFPNDRPSTAAAMSNPWIHTQILQPVMPRKIIEDEPRASSISSTISEFASWNTNPEALEDTLDGKPGSTATIVPIDSTAQQTSTTQTGQYSSPQIHQPVMPRKIIEDEPHAPSIASTISEFASWNANPKTLEDIQQTRSNPTATVVPVNSTAQQTSMTQTGQYSSPQIHQPTLSTGIITGDSRVSSLPSTMTKEPAAWRTIPEANEDIQQIRSNPTATMVPVNSTPERTTTPQETGLIPSGNTTLQALSNNQAATSMTRPSDLRPKYWAGDSLYRQGKYKVAERLFREVFLGRENILGYDHEQTLDSAHWLGITIYRREGYEEAENLFQIALKGREKVLGPDHEKTLESADWLGDSFFHQKRHKEAERMFRQGLRGRENTVGHVDEETAHSAHWVGHSLFYQQLYKDAEVMYRRALRVRLKVLGCDHQQTLCSALWLGHTFIEQGLFEQAQKIFLRTLRGREKTLGPDHEDTLESSYYYNCSLDRLRYSSDTISIAWDMNA